MSRDNTALSPLLALPKPLAAAYDSLTRIGSACARDLFAQGARVVVTYNSSHEAAQRLVEELTAAGDDNRGPGPQVSKIQVDLSEPESVPDLLAYITKTYGQTPDILVANAGYGKRIPNIADIPEDEFDKMINVNLRVAFRLCKACLPGMTARGWGRVVFVSSISGQGGGVNGCHYAASKAGLVGLMKNLARKHAADGITLNDVAPAMIGNTGMIPDEKTVEGTPGDVRNIPVGRLGTPQEVANVVTMFCRTGYMTGQSILLSGGLL